MNTPSPASNESYTSRDSSPKAVLPVTPFERAATSPRARERAQKLIDEYIATHPETSMSCSVAERSFDPFYKAAFGDIEPGSSSSSSSQSNKISGVSWRVSPPRTQPQETDRGASRKRKSSEAALSLTIPSLAGSDTGPTMMGQA
ncbi:hypothetical protein M408DRAFT_332234 [Serendipita vermifera MAFF 305830]|uniref:Uncharacterized protein n=1 Tax=Serendipita vermifera MAFF 305830 TaxID=933852 RepID=A0A0C3AWL1_SERVB|nr:hypothetical protein M408DRAFT_332234 [Serendipita vermifera MAFF 305830]